MYGDQLPTTEMSINLPPNSLSNLRNQDPDGEDRFSDTERRVSPGSWDRYSDDEDDFDYPEESDRHRSNFRSVINSAPLTEDLYDNSSDRFPGHGDMELGSHDRLNYSDYSDRSPQRVFRNVSEDRSLDFERELSSRGDSGDEERFVEEDEMDWQQRPNMDLGLISRSSFQAEGEWSNQLSEGMLENILTDRDGNVIQGRLFESDPDSWLEIQGSTGGRSPVYSAGQRSPVYRRSRSSLRDTTDIFQRHSAERSPIHSSGRRSHFRDRRSADRSRRDKLSRSRRDSSDRRSRSKKNSPGRSSGSRRDSPERSSRSRRDLQDRSSRSRRDSLHGSSRSRRNSADRSSRHSARRRSPRRSSDEDAPESTESKSNKPRSVSFVKGMMCPACKGTGKTFTARAKFMTKWKFIKHWKNVHAKFIFAYSCPMQLCCESFPNHGGLLSHVRKEHNNGVALNSRLETFLRQEIECLKVEKEPQIDPGNLTFYPVDLEQKKEVKKSSLTREAAIVQSLLDTGTPLATFNTVLEKSQGINPRLQPEAKAGHSFSDRHKTNKSKQLGHKGLKPLDYQARNMGNQKLKHRVKASKAVCPEDTPIVFHSGMVCPICPVAKKYMTWYDYRNHWLSYHIQHHQRYPCPHINCHIAANSLPKLKKHYTKYHNKGNELMASIVQMLDGVKSEMITNEKFMDPRNFKFDTGKQSEELVQGQTTTIVFQPGMKCPVCKSSRNFPSEYDFYTHWQLRHNEFCEKYPCPVHGCTSSPISLEFLRRHYRKFHGDGQEVGDAVHWVVSVRTKNSRFVDPGNLTYDPGEVELVEEVEPEVSKPVPIVFEPGMKCPICLESADFQKEVDFRNHWLLNHIEFQEGYACPHSGCTSLLASGLKLLRHYRKHHNANEVVSDEMESTLSSVKSERIKNMQYVDPGKFTFDYDNEDFKKKVTFDINPNVSVDTV